MPVEKDITVENAVAAEDAWFVLYVRSGSEDKIMRTLAQNIDTERFIPFFPTKMLYYDGGAKGKANPNGREVRCFPGYIFFRVLKTADNIAEFHSNVVRSVQNVDKSYYFLYYGLDKRDIEMHDSEKAALKRLMNSKFCIDVSCGYKEGDSVRIVSGPLEGLTNYVIKSVRRHKRTIKISIPIMGADREMTLGFDVIEKI